MTRLLVVEPNAGGHRAEHLAWIADAYRQRHEIGSLAIAAPPSLLDPAPLALEGARLIPVAAWPNEAPRAQRVRELHDVIAAARPRDVLLTSAEHFLSTLATRGAVTPEASGGPTSGGAGTRISAITFRPTLHYSDLGSPPDTLGERLARMGKRWATWSALRHRALHTLFSLDETAVPALRALAPPGVRVEHLPDPVPHEPSPLAPEAVRAEWGVERGRTVALLAGGLDARKGALATLAAIPRVRAEAARALAVVFAGAVRAEEQSDFERLRAATESSGVQVVVREGRVPDGHLQGLITAADLLLVPYQRHVGSSGFVMRAAGAGVPVVAQDWGAMGHVVRSHRLGRTVDTLSPEALATALGDAALAPRDGFDAESARAFAAANTLRHFTDTLLDALL